MVTLPELRKEPLSLNPKRLLLFSTPKVGKTTLVSGLENNLIIDVESGSRYVSGIVYDVKAEAVKSGNTVAKQLRLLSEAIVKANSEKGDYVYDYITIDTITSLEKVAREMATVLYKRSNVGKKFKGTDVVTELEMGAGYNYLRQAFAILYGYFDGLARNGIILLGHVKGSSIKRDGKEISAIDIDLTGKLKQIVSADMDAIGILYRNKKNNNELIVSFKTTSDDLITGARPKHLRNKEFVISKLNENGEFEFYWDKIYLKNNKKEVKKNDKAKED